MNRVNRSLFSWILAHGLVGGVPAVTWILENNIWSDIGVWDDLDVWKD